MDERQRVIIEVLTTLNPLRKIFDLAEIGKRENYLDLLISAFFEIFTKIPTPAIAKISADPP